MSWVLLTFLADSPDEPVPNAPVRGTEAAELKLHLDEVSSIEELVVGDHGVTPGDVHIRVRVQPGLEIHDVALGLKGLFPSYRVNVYKQTYQKQSLIQKSFLMLYIFRIFEKN